MPNSTRLGEVYLPPHKTLRFNLNKDVSSRHPNQNLIGTAEKLHKSPWHKYIMNTFNTA